MLSGGWYRGFVGVNQGHSSGETPDFGDEIVEIERFGKPTLGTTFPGQSPGIVLRGENDERYLRSQPVSDPSSTVDTIRGSHVQVQENQAGGKMLRETALA